MTEYILAHTYDTDDPNHVFMIYGYDPCCGMAITDKALCGVAWSGVLIVDHNRVNRVCESCNRYLLMRELSE